MILKQIRSDLKEGRDGLRGEAQKTNERLDQTNLRLENIKDMQDLLVNEHRKANQRLDFFAEELVRGRTARSARCSSRSRAPPKATTAARAQQVLSMGC